MKKNIRKPGRKPKPKIKCIAEDCDKDAKIGGRCRRHHDQFIRLMKKPI